jgi:hypothetical protein
MAYTTIDNPELYFQCKLYTGNGGTQSITLDGSENMEPDLVWTKLRSTGTYPHVLTDSVRGATKNLYANLTDGEDASSNYLTSFDSNGFSIGSYAGVNLNSNTLVAWCWKESATAGFDMVLYTGNGSNRTIAHSLSATPDLVIIKRRSDTGDWLVGGSTTLGGDNKLLLLNTTAALDDNSEVYQSFSSSTFGIGVNAYVNTDSSTHIAYVFSGKQGFSKFGSYTGNGNADGTFIHLGFRPAFFMIKKSSATDPWVIFDNKRAPYNYFDKLIYPDSNEAESGAAERGDFVSNGVKFKSNHTFFNGSGITYIYMAFAEQPFVNSNGVPANAR